MSTLKGLTETPTQIKSIHHAHISIFQKVRMFGVDSPSKNEIEYLPWKIAQRTRQIKQGYHNYFQIDITLGKEIDGTKSLSKLKSKPLLR